jgi:hypothetical protein
MRKTLKQLETSGTNKILSIYEEKFRYYLFV